MSSYQIEAAPDIINEEIVSPFPKTAAIGLVTVENLIHQLAPI
jgi:hypothetical protein